MKQKFSSQAILPVIVLSTLVLSSCDTITQLTQINVPMTIIIPINAKHSSLPFIGVNNVDINSNSSFNDNKARIKGVDLTKIGQQLVSYVGTPDKSIAIYSKIDYTLQFDSQYGDKTEYTIGFFENVKPTDLKGIEKIFDVTNAALKSALDFLADKPKITIKSKYTLQNGIDKIETMTWQSEDYF